MTNQYSDLPSGYQDWNYAPDVMRMLLTVPFPNYEIWLERVIDEVIRRVKNNERSLTELECLEIK